MKVDFFLCSLTPEKVSAMLLHIYPKEKPKDLYFLWKQGCNLQKATYICQVCIPAHPISFTVEKIFAKCLLSQVLS